MPDPTEPLTLTVTVDKAEREAVGSVRVVLKGTDEKTPPGSRVAVDLTTPPHKARTMPVSSKWRMTLERVD